MLKSKWLEEGNKISENTIVHGSIQSEKSIVIQGETLGYVVCENQIKIGEKGIVRQNIKGKNCHINGTVDGDVIAENEIELGNTAMIAGNIECKRLKIDIDAQLGLFKKIMNQDTLPMPTEENETSS